MIFQRQHQCAHCANFVGDGACLAFPGGIPGPLLTGEVAHREPYPGDNGVVFQLKQQPLEAPDRMPDNA